MKALTKVAGYGPQGPCKTSERAYGAVSSRVATFAFPAGDRALQAILCGLRGIRSDPQGREFVNVEFGAVERTEGGRRSRGPRSGPKLVVGTLKNMEQRKNTFSLLHGINEKAR